MASRCFDQLNDLNKEYKLGVKVVSFKELITESMIVPDKFKVVDEDEDETAEGLVFVPVWRAAAIGPDPL